jgi:hypothetical protein
MTTTRVYGTGKVLRRVRGDTADSAVGTTRVQRHQRRDLWQSSPTEVQFP